MTGGLRILVLLLVALVAAAGCSGGSETAIRLTVTFAPPVALEQLALELDPEGESASPKRLLVPEAPAPLASGTRVLVLVPAAWGDQTVELQVSGLKQGQAQGHGKVQVAVVRDTVVDVTVALVAAPACADECPAGDTQCTGDQVRGCLVDASGCARWTAPQDCPKETPFCSKGRCAAKCEDECPANERRCASGDAGVDRGYQVCGEHDSDTCTDWGQVLGCGAKELCQGGACVPECEGKSCACTPGESVVCTPVGECQGGERVCNNDGTYGPCNWAAGPKVEECDGKDNDCDGTADNGLVPPSCAQQAGACAGATKTCSGALGWLGCGASEYAAHSAEYEASETRCDGKDNDCDGQTDEPSACLPAGCEPDGARTCTGSTPQICAKGKWLPQSACQGAMPVCANGNCVQCATGEARCNGDTPAICIANKWSLQPPCSGSHQYCLGGSCVLCSKGLANCNLQSPDKCEIDTSSSAAHCGACNKPCADTESCTADSCQGGKCVFAALAAGTSCTSDNNVCTLDACSGGLCKHSPTKEGDVCVPGGECSSPAKCTLGVCPAPSPKPDGAPCGTTKLERCKGGACATAKAYCHTYRWCETYYCYSGGSAVVPEGEGGGQDVQCACDSANDLSIKIIDLNEYPCSACTTLIEPGFPEDQGKSSNKWYFCW